MPGTQAKLVIREAKASDARAIAALSAKVYSKADAFSGAQIRGQINNFPEGQFVAEYEGKIVGHCATLIVDEDLAFAQHSWDEVTGGGFATRHDEDGDVLYGMEVCVDPDYRRLRIGERFYRRRQELCQYFELKGIAFGGRMPGYKRRRKQYPDPQDYLNAVVEKKLRDPVINFQLTQGFEPRGILKGYDSTDQESGGLAVLMFWPNPLAPEKAQARKARGQKRLPSSVRVATVQFQMRRISTIDEFEEQVEYWVDVAADYKSDFVVFPELFTLELLSIEKAKLGPTEAIEKIAGYTERFCKFMEGLAVSYNINIIGGSHPTRVANGEIRNISYVFLRDGASTRRKSCTPHPPSGNGGTSRAAMAPM